MGQGLLLIPLVRVSIINIGSRFSIKIWILAFLGKYSNIFVGSQSVSIEIRIIFQYCLLGLKAYRLRFASQGIVLHQFEDIGMGLSIYYVTFVGGLILELFYPNGSNPQLVGYVDTSYLSNPHKSQSRTWYLFTYLWQQCYFIETEQQFMLLPQIILRLLQFMKQAMNVFGWDQ